MSGLLPKEDWILLNQFPQKCFIIILHLIAAGVMCFPQESYFQIGMDQSEDEGHQVYEEAAVSTFARECAPIGSNVLAHGGSAVDAAISILICEGVANPWRMGIGGGFLMTIHDAKTGSTTFLDAKESAPSGANENMFLGVNVTLNKGLFAAVPGQIKGYWAVHQKFGRLPWRDLFEPTIKLCEFGFKVSTYFYNSLLGLQEVIKSEPTLSETFLNPQTNEVYMENEIFKNHKLAKTLTRIAEDPDPVGLFYNGSLTKELIEDISSYGGILTAEDFVKYEVKWRDPIKIPLENFTIYTSPPPGSGALLGLIMNVFAGFEKTDMSTFWQRLAETFKWVFAKRTLLGDQDFVDGVDVEIRNITSRECADSIRAQIRDDKTYTDPEYYQAKYSFKPDRGTEHVSVLAPDGSAVSVTTSINNDFGAQFVSRSTGIIINDQMNDFSSPNITNIYNIKPSPKNFIHPFKRPWSSMVPTIVMDDENKVYMIIGASGGPKITTAVSQIMLLNLKYGYTLKQAMDQLRLHHQLLPMQVVLEKGFSKEIEYHLRKIGHEIIQSPVNFFSAVTAIKKIGKKRIIAYSDTRIYGENSSTGF